MSEFPRYDRYPADILADTRHLTLAEKGAYGDLLDTMWLQGARLPNDPKRLGRIVGASNMHWSRIWPRLQEFFIVSEDGKWLTQKRMSEEFQKARERKERQREGGRKSAITASKTSAMTASNLAAMDGRNPLTDNNQGGVSPPTTRARDSINQQPPVQDQNEALLSGASSDPVANDPPERASSAREAERHAAWLHKIAERNRPVDPNHPTLLAAEAEQVEQYRRAKHLRERLKAAGFKGLRIIPP